MVVENGVRVLGTVLARILVFCSHDPSPREKDMPSRPVARASILKMARCPSTVLLSQEVS
jgi:hypothetical protein